MFEIRTFCQLGNSKAAYWFVHFRHKEVIIYPDDTVKPLIGQGLNRRAQVTLDRVWPHDKSSHEPITDPKRLIEMDYEGKLRRVAAKHDTKFLEYRPETGSWVFKVDHFSKYGLSDSDDEDSEIKTSQSDSPMKLCETLIEQPIIDDPNYRELHLPAIENKDAVSYSFNFSTFDHEKVLNMQSVCSPSSVHARLVGTESHTLQLMKASFFEFANNDFTQESINQTQRLHYQCSQDVAKLCNVIRKADEKEIPYSCLPSIIAQDDSASDFENSIMNRNKFSVDNSMGVEMKNALEVPNFGPKIAILKFKSGVAQFKNSMFYNHRLKYVADIGIQMGKIFKPSWGPGLKIIVPLNVQPNTSNICSQNSLDCSYGDIKCTNVVQCFQFLGYRCLENDYNQALKSSIEGHLNIQLLYSKIENYEDCPFITAVTDSSSITALRSHKSHSLSAACNSDVITPEPLSTYFANVWTLCESLWGQISDSEPSLNNNSHEDAMLRKDAVSNWLKLITAQTIQSEVTEMEIKDEIILSLLSANKLEEACDTALKDGDHCLALLLSQLGGTITTRELIKQQIELWQDTDVDKNFSVNRLKLFMLVAGVPITYRNNEAVNICENLDWKRALAIHLWYISYPTSSIADALNLYETSFFASAMNIYSASPRPEYFKNETVTETTNGKPAYDLCYYLIKLYCVGNFSLEVLLDPQTYTYDPIDYSLSWFLQQILKSLGYTHLSEHTSELLHANFAAQLETYDLWQWAIFVVLHFKNPIRRCRAITELLLRNADLNKASEYIKSEIFLKTKLHLSCKWINEAKAVKSLAMQRYGEAAWYFIQAQDWNKGHEIILQHLATEAIINEDYDYVQSLLSLLVSNNSSNIISEWGSQGQLIWDYITVTTEVKRLLKEGKYSDIVYNLELLKPQLTTLCTKIDQFPCPTVKHRLCQAEMAKKTLHLARNLLMLQQKESSKEHNTNNFLIRLISQLPLPEDYAQQELRPIINICINNIVSQ